jgi:hypothetical protein
MLTINQCDKTLNKKKKKFTKDEVIKIREFLYKMARIVVESKNTVTDGK